MSFHWINHKGIKVLYNDARQKSPRQLHRLLLDYTEFFKRIDDPIVHRVINFENTAITEKMAHMGYKLGKEVFSKKRGITVFVGVTGIKKLYFKLYTITSGYKVVTRDSLETALLYIEKNSPRTGLIKPEVRTEPSDV